ncbi:MAG: 16S rRNA (adenine(1518)-N(6)/adenine(1519)-N(6))-dimethyltransferase RsmA [Gammaproteobacteria bacterium]|nr:16S rRNA (adenine(1518)-N(6)/adenine(1519)-N(6))-dimethyltransferase RsmA [Gammaproteobacteria bacterium]
MAHIHRKRFGQHFLHDPAIIQKIISAIAPAVNDKIIEIGPGLGAITLPLLNAVNRLTAIEIDRDAAAALAGHIDGTANLEIIVGDALKTDFCAVAAGLAPPQAKARIVGNLPYNISTPLMFHLLNQVECIADMHFMLQKEVVRRMTASPGNKQYGRLTIMLALRCRAERLFDIGPGAFNPPPRVASSFVRLIPDGTLADQLNDMALFENVVRTAFSGRRKTLRRSLADLIETDDFAQAEVDAGRRPEQLSTADFVRLANACTARRGAAL